MIFRENLKRAALVWTVVIGHSTTLMAEVFEIFPGENAEEALQESMVLASPGDEIVIAEGIYSIKNQLSLAVDDLTITGAGMDKTILNLPHKSAAQRGFLSQETAPFCVTLPLRTPKVTPSNPKVWMGSVL